MSQAIAESNTKSISQFYRKSELELLYQNTLKENERLRADLAEARQQRFDAIQLQAAQYNQAKIASLEYTILQRDKTIIYLNERIALLSKDWRAAEPLTQFGSPASPLIIELIKAAHNKVEPDKLKLEIAKFVNEIIGIEQAMIRMMKEKS